MPNIWTHILFCEEVVDGIGRNHPFLQYENYMRLGSQGPDPFFYYNFWPWIKDEPIHDIGMALHTRHCGLFLLDMIEAAKECDDKVRSFVTGFITHHVLDRNTHPYIHYKAGYEGNNHQLLEVTIDTVMMERFQHIKTWKTPVYKEIDIGRKPDDKVVNLLFQLINKHYPTLKQNDASYIKKAYRDMILALRILADPTGIKHKLIGRFIAGYSHQPVTDEVDYLNEEKATWYHPATKEACNQSFLELYTQARIEGIDILTEVLNYWEHDSSYSMEKLKSRIGNISYDTGKPLQLQLENKYADPIL